MKMTLTASGSLEKYRRQLSLLTEFSNLLVLRLLISGNQIMALRTLERTV